MSPTIIPAIFLAKDKMSSTIARMSKGVNRFASESSARLEKAGKKAFAYGRKMAIQGAVIAAPLVLAGREAVKFEDKMSDIGKTTGLQGKDLRDFGDDILQMSLKTRSSTEDLATIAEIGGRLGIVGKRDLKAFTSSANEFAVALGGDFSGGVEAAITQFGKVTQLFKDTKDLDISDGLRKAGSAMNSLSAKGVNVEGLTDFALRVGSLNDVLKPTLAQTTALGSVLQKAGVSSEIASSGFKSFLSRAGNDLPMFAKQMNISAAEAKNLFNTDSAKFFVDFAASMNGLPADQVSKKLKDLRLNSNEIQGVIGVLASKQGDYNDMLAISNDQMSKGTSIGQEYNTKNNNTAAQFAKLKNNVMFLAVTIGNALLPAINSIVEAVSPYLTAAGEWMKRNKGTVKTIALVVAGLSALSFAISGVAFVVGGLQKVFAVAGVAFKAFNMLFLSNPIGMWVLGITAAIMIVVGLTKALTGMSYAQEINSEVQNRAIEKAADQRIEISSLFNTLRKAKEGTDQYTQALAAVEKMQPGITDKYNLQTKSVQALNMAEKDLIKTVMDRAYMDAKGEVAKEKYKSAIMKAEGGTGSDTGVQSFIRFMGGGETVDKMKRIEAKGEMFQADRLTKEIEDAKNKSANPEQAKQESILKNQVNINFTGLPDGAVALVNGKPAPASGGGLKINSGGKTR